MALTMTDVSKPDIFSAGVFRPDSDQPVKFDYKALMADSANRLKPVTEPVTPDTVVDSGKMPGDRRGAAGLDTSFFA